MELVGESVVEADRGPVVSARDVRVWYGTTRGAIRAVDGVSFEIAVLASARAFFASGVSCRTAGCTRRAISAALTEQLAGRVRDA